MNQYDGLDGRRRNAFRKLDEYVEGHPDKVDELGRYFDANPGASTAELKNRGFGGFLWAAMNSTNLLKEYFGIGHEHFNLIRVSDEEWEKRRGDFGDFVRETQGRFGFKDLPTGFNRLVSSNYNGKIYRAVFDVCKNGNEEYKPEDFLSFGNYVAGMFFLKRALFAREQDIGELESGTYEGLVKVKDKVSFSFRDAQVSSYLLWNCFRDLERVDNFIGGVASSIGLGRARSVLKYRFNRALFGGDEILKSFEHFGTSPNMARVVRRILNREEVVSLEDVGDRGIAEGKVYSFGRFEDVKGENVSARVVDELDTLRFFVSSIGSNDRDRDIFLRRVLCGESLECIAKDWSITKERVRQINEKVLSVLRRKFDNVKWEKLLLG